MVLAWCQLDQTALYEPKGGRLSCRLNRPPDLAIPEHGQLGQTTPKSVRVPLGAEGRRFESDRPDGTCAIGRVARCASSAPTRLETAVERRTTCRVD